MYHRINNFKDALKCFSKVLAKIADDKTVYIARGLAYQDMGNHQLAIKDFNAALVCDPDLSEGYYRSGISKFHSKRYKDAIRDFGLASDKEDKACEDDAKPSERNPGIQDGYGRCYHALGDHEEALRYYDKAIEMDPVNT